VLTHSEQEKTSKQNRPLPIAIEHACSLNVQQGKYNAALTLFCAWCNAAATASEEATICALACARIGKPGSCCSAQTLSPKQGYALA